MPPPTAAGDLYPLAGVHLQSTNITFLPHMCGMVPVGFAFANGEGRRWRQVPAAPAVPEHPKGAAGAGCLLRMLCHWHS